ncbi:MAG: cysteine desulfurase [Firmicutes bacterium]|nr:cysteine desulfurase [Bacillota bacterium]
MIYLDYAANTPVDREVLRAFDEATIKYFGNPNSSHGAGVDAKKAIDLVSENISKYFNTSSESVIYTSGSSESNNLVIKGLVEANKKNGNKIIISAVEHSSIVAPCNYLVNLGYDVSVIPLTDKGVVDVEKIREELDDNTILVSICAVDGEVGTIEPIEEIAKIVKEYPNCSFHTDATQAIGKVNINYDDVDFITFAPHKFFGLNGFGVLVNRNNKKLMPIIHGGKSTTIFRSGTPVTANVVALGKAFELATSNLEYRYNYNKKINELLRDKLSGYDHVHINSPINSIPSTLNISLIGISSKSMIKELNEKEIYLTTTTACSLDNMMSKPVYALTKSEELANNTIRISISHLTTEDDINKFLKEFDIIYNKLLNNANNN